MDTAKTCGYAARFTVTDANLKNLYLKIQHDDNAEVYLNGKQVYRVPGLAQQVQIHTA